MNIRTCIHVYCIHYTGVKHENEMNIVVGRITEYIKFKFNVIYSVGEFNSSFSYLMVETTCEVG